MKILIIRETNPFYASNASNNRFLALAEGLSQKGVFIHILIIRSYFCEDERRKYPEKGVKNGVNYTYLMPYYIHNRILRGIFHVFIFRSISRLCTNIENLIIAEKYDYLWLEPSDLTTKIGIILIKKKLNIRFFQERSEYSWIGLPTKSKMHLKYLNEYLPRLDVMAVMTKALYHYYGDYIGEQTGLIHLPMTVDFSRFENMRGEGNLNKPYIAYCGTMNNAKDGVDILIKAFIKIMHLHSGIHLYLAGPLLPLNDYEVQMQIIKENHAENRITYLGLLNKEDIPEFLSNAKVLALARPSSKQADGGFPTKLGEYLATGNVVCVTLTGEIGDYLIDAESAFLAEPDSVDSFSDSMDRALKSMESSKIGESGRNVALKYFNKEIQCANLFNYLSKMLK